MYEELIGIYESPELRDFYNDYTTKQKDDAIGVISDRIHAQSNLGNKAQVLYNAFEKRFLRDLNDERTLYNKMKPEGINTLGKTADENKNSMYDAVVGDVLKRKSRF